jgi:Protein of unknown function (DUF3667)
VQAQDASPAACCQNCQAQLAGSYCQACGQRHDPHPHSLKHFGLELFEDISHADSRLWRTLWALASKPGYLTLEFFAGRRQRYLPPVRLYLILSVVLFALLSALRSNEEMNINLKVAAAVQQGSSTEDSCVNFDLTESNSTPAPWMTLLAERIKPACEDIIHNQGKHVREAVAHNIPRMMFVLLPLIALCMSLLYWRPRRFYVEHVLLLIHNHVFVFGGLIVLSLVGGVPWVGELLSVALPLYALWYLYASMRRYYGQSRRRTLAKLAAVLVCYGLLGVVLLLATLLITAVTL